MDTKRAFDIAAATTALVALSPVFGLVSLATAAHFKQSPFYLVDRAGKDGRPFRMIKFRSMRDGKVAEDLSEEDDAARTTAFGKFLRGTSIDELPQLLNILKGDMSFVGPRPRTAELRGGDAIPDEYRDILSIRPGLTGAWQLAAIGNTVRIPPDLKLKIEADYVRSHPSLTKDLSMIAKTIPAFILGHDGESFDFKRALNKIKLL